MASIKLYFDTRSPRKDGNCPIKIAVNHKGSFLINLKGYMTFEEFSQHTIIRGLLKLPPTLPAERWILNQRMLQTKAKLLNLSLSGRLTHMSNQELKRELEGNRFMENNEDTPLLFKDRYTAYTFKMTKPNTLVTYECTYRKITEFTNPETLTFEQMNYGWIKDFDNFMQRQGMKPNARSIIEPPNNRIRSIKEDSLF